MPTKKVLCVCGKEKDKRSEYCKNCPMRFNLQVTKTCPTCEKKLPLTDYYIRKETGRPRGECKECEYTRTMQRPVEKRTAEGKLWKQNNPDKVIAQKRRESCRKYGIDETYIPTILGLVFTQDNCDICKRSLEKEEIAILNIDHDHTTNKFRGLLCNNCNWGIGQFNDNVELMKAAIFYIETNKKKPKH